MVYKSFTMEGLYKCTFGLWSGMDSLLAIFRILSHSTKTCVQIVLLWRCIENKDLKKIEIEVSRLSYG